MPKCELCGCEFRLITASHLKYWHGTTTWEYKADFPDSPMRDSDFFFNKEAKNKAISDSWWNKTEEERYKIRQNLSEAHKDQSPSNEVKKRISESTKLWQSRPGYKEEQSKRMSKIMTEVWTRPEYRELKSKQQKELMDKLWNDPSYRRNIIEAQHRKPTLDERVLTILLNEVFPDQWMYIGDKPFIEGLRRSPDFIHANLTLNKLIEYDPLYWHETYRDDPPGLKRGYYWDQGYTLLILDDTDLWNPEGPAGLIKKVEEFTEQV